MTQRIQGDNESSSRGQPRKHEDHGGRTGRMEPRMNADEEPSRSPHRAPAATHRAFRPCCCQRPITDFCPIMSRVSQARQAPFPQPMVAGNRFVPASPRRRKQVTPLVPTPSLPGGYVSRSTVLLAPSTGTVRARDPWTDTKGQTLRRTAASSPSSRLPPLKCATGKSHPRDWPRLPGDPGEGGSHLRLSLIRLHPRWDRP